MQTRPPSLPPDVVRMLADMPEPRRSSEWFKICYEEDSNGEITQAKIWRAYKDIFNKQVSEQKPLLASTALIKQISHSFPRARTVKRENPDDPDGNAFQPQITLEPRLAGDRLGLTSQRDEFRTRGAGMVDTARDDNVRCTPLAQDPAAWSAAAKREYPGTNSGSGTPSRLFAGPQPSGHPLPTLQQGRAQRPTGRSMN
ncbi:Chromatin structure-remodeling complex protein rsc9, partial [Cryomyces antarcticus]